MHSTREGVTDHLSTLYRPSPGISRAPIARMKMILIPIKFPQNNYNNPRRELHLLRTICITVFFSTFWLNKWGWSRSCRGFQNLIMDLLLNYHSTFLTSYCGSAWDQRLHCPEQIHIILNLIDRYQQERDANGWDFLLTFWAVNIWSNRDKWQINSPTKSAAKAASTMTTM